MGFAFCALGIATTGLVLMHRHVFLDEIDGMTYFTKILLSLSALGTGLFMLLFARNEKLRINKAEDSLYVEKKNIFCENIIKKRYLHLLK